MRCTRCPCWARSARVLTVRSYHYEDEKKNVNIEVPAIDVEFGGADWAENVNQLETAGLRTRSRGVGCRCYEDGDAFRIVVRRATRRSEYHSIGGIQADYEVHLRL